jgi:hypothetical protein
VTRRRVPLRLATSLGHELIEAGVLITAGVTARRWAMRSWHGGLGSAMSGDEITQG